jgi:tetratricopeptide (TPR) repeat protein
MLSKETAVILPAVIFFHNLAGIPATGTYPKERNGRVRLALWETVPYLMVTGLYLCARFWVLRGVPATTAGWISRRDALLTMPSVLLFYLGHLIWPWKLSVNYDLLVVSRVQNELFWVPLILLASGASAMWVCLRRTGDKRVLAAVLWLLLPLAPVVYIRLFAQDDSVHDRYLYLPVLGFAVLAGLLSEFLRKRKTWLRSPGFALVAFGLAITLLGLVTAAQAQPWRNNLLLYTNAVRVAPNNMLARNNLAGEYVRQGRYAEAGQMFKAILEKRPGMWLANYNYGFLSYRSGNLALAEECLRRAILIDPSDPDEHVYLGATYLKEGRLVDAAQQVREGIARKPDGTGYHFTLGIAEWRLGNLVLAREEMIEELKYHPETAVARVQMEAIERQLGARALQPTPNVPR